MTTKTKKGATAKPVYKQWWFWLICCVLVAVVVVVAIILTRPQENTQGDSDTSASKEIAINASERVYITRLGTAIAQDKLNGTGKASKDVCATFRNLAFRWDKDTDWFAGSYCDKSVMRADYSETEKTATYALFDGSHTAVYTFDASLYRLIDFSFGPSVTKGRLLDLTD